jgi:hypothetical protein
MGRVDGKKRRSTIFMPAGPFLLRRAIVAPLSLFRLTTPQSTRMVSDATTTGSVAAKRSSTEPSRPRP